MGPAACGQPEIWLTPWRPGRPGTHPLPADDGSCLDGVESPVYDRTGRVGLVASVTCLRQGGREACARTCRRDGPSPWSLPYKVVGTGHYFRQSLRMWLTTVWPRIRMPRPQPSH